HQAADARLCVCRAATRAHAARWRTASLRRGSGRAAARCSYGKNRNLLLEMSAVATGALGLARTELQRFERLIAVFAEIFKDGHSDSDWPRVPRFLLRHHYKGAA